MSDNRTLHGLVAQWASRQPGQIAIEYGTARVGYGELARRMRAAAAWFEPDQVVAVLLGDSPATVSTLLGVLAAGSSFVCVDPDSPPQRVRAVLAEARCRTAVVSPTGHQLTSVLRDLGVDLVLCEPDGTLTGSAPPDRALPEVDPAATAYVAYTSGSTGRPKGVVQSHRTFLAFLDWQSEAFDLRPGRKMAHWATTTYDASYCEIFGALCYGATLWMAPRSLRHDPFALLEQLAAAGVHVLQTVPSFLRQVLAEAQPGSLPALTHVFAAGEVLTPDLAARCRATFPHAALTNLYGPTETVLATYHRVEAADLDRPAIPLGVPIDGCRVLLLDAGHRPVPDGEVGEVYLVSESMADGYLAQPAPTAASFLPVPGEPGSRMYRTGDQARRDHDGTLLFAGRTDGQIKIRGMRVETGEIETVLFGHPAVGHCAVRPRGEGESLRLEAHVVARGELTAEQVRAYLSQRLPKHMVPTRYRFTDQLPLTRTGKTDRGALPEITARTTAEPPRPHQDSTEAKVAGLWRDLLGVPAVTAADDFFQLGGQSMDAMRLANRVWSAFSVRVPYRAVFDARTLTDYTRVVRDAQATAPSG
ncbi:non-ribosomal peptide synthetase [Kibdelosporangium phytohabitans]|uniref:Carrier domain-containing protein n=1 Tax=Kibdelosporangium phytohabitans TaxID=860235 RepID=A0A0N9IBF2_9PSEU|nr:non-ribosomal peptide synthetase [Kibdelosporangium phytohabitans]ALG12488.1 hypothetical protein AOZ06_41510 [Kibdelosporangium phytohabitans]MBE1464082.1 amino acid adenylation domain-containing protein [Kibdelosporangium phytohabitans]